MVCIPAGLIAIRKIRVPWGIPNAAADPLAQNVGVTCMSGDINHEVNHHTVEGGMDNLIGFAAGPGPAPTRSVGAGSPIWAAMCGW